MSRAYPEEKVGVFAQQNGENLVVEYSELGSEDACATDASKPCLNVYFIDWPVTLTSKPAFQIRRPQMDGCTMQ